MIDNIETLRREHEQLVRAAERAKGKRQAVLDRLKQEFGVGTVEEAETLLVKLRRREKKAAEADYAAKQEYVALLEQNRDAIAQFLEGLE